MTSLRSLALAALLILPLSPRAPHQLSASDLLARADRAYQSQSYNEALADYRLALTDGVVTAERRNEVGLRVVECIGRTQHFDEALEASLAYVKQHKGTVWEARGLYWIGRLYLGLPYTAYRAGGKITYSEDVPKSDSGRATNSAEVGDLNALNARDALEAARVLYPHFRDQGTASEEIQLDFDLAHVLSTDPDYRWVTAGKWLSPRDSSWKVDVSGPYQPGWLYPKRMMYLYAQIEDLAALVPDSAHMAALGLYDKAIWLREYHQQMSHLAQRWNGKEWVTIPYPYQNDSEQDSIRQIIQHYPDDAIRDQAQYALVSWLEADGKFEDAIASCRGLLARHPHGAFAREAKYMLEMMTQPEVQADTRQNDPAHLNEFTLTYRNARVAHCRAYRVRPEQVVTGPEASQRVNGGGWNDFHNVYAPSDHLSGKPVAGWTVTLEDNGNHMLHNVQIKLPFSSPGAYVIEVTTPGARTVGGMMLGDLVAVEQMHRGACLVYTADMKTSRPRRAHIMARFHWNVSGHEFTKIVTGMTAQDGTLDIPFPAHDDAGMNAAVLAYQGDEYALTNENYVNEFEQAVGKYRIYKVTDQAVYRPAQTVHFRELVFQRESSAWLPVAHQLVSVTSYNPSGTAIYTRKLRTDAFGAVSSELTLKPDAPLGEYSLQVKVNGYNTFDNGNGDDRFRVEEYKKPEFKVSVLPDAGRVVIGKTAGARIHAEYYFGGPVPGGRVSYRVYRTRYYSYYQFPQPFDFLYRRGSSGDYDTAYRQGDIVLQGDTRCDAQGNARITFDTNPRSAVLQPSAQARMYWYYRMNPEDDQDYQYTVEADVQDASRRVISGVGDLKATHYDVAVFLNYANGYASQGDQVEVEVHTQDAGAHPIARQGMATVYREPDHPGGKLGKPVFQTPVATDVHGRGYIRWVAQQAGAYRMEFATRDSAHKLVSGVLPLWVAGPELARTRFLFQGVALRVKNRYCPEGSAAKLLLVTQDPDTTCLLTTEADNLILDRRLVHVNGRTMELSVPIDSRHAPNFYVHVVSVRHGVAEASTEEIYVPPVKQLATVTVHTDKLRYHPGDTATLHIHAMDAGGRPLHAEMSLAVSDAALSYIQKDYAGDIRRHFYGDERSQSVYSGTSLSDWVVSVSEQFPPLDAVSSQSLVLPDGTGRIHDWPGHESRLDAQSSGLTLAPPDWMARRPGYWGRRGSAFGQNWGMMGGITSGFGGGGMGGAGYFGRGMSHAAVSRSPGSVNGLGMSDLFAFDGDNSIIVARGSSFSSPPDIRSRFLDTALWAPAVITDAHGDATVKVKWPDNLTQWRAVAVGCSAAGQVGTAETSTEVKKDLIVRLQTPRFMVERDRLILSANVHNYLATSQRVRVALNLGGGGAEVVAGGNPDYPGPSSAADTWIDVPSNTEKRVDWWVRVVREGSLSVRVSAQSSAASDGMEMTVPVIVHGVERAVAQGGVLREQNRASIPIALPEERKPGSSELVVRLEPSLAGILLDSLPYLAGYPYGCTEQTLSRFVPSVLVAKSLRDAGYSLDDLRNQAHRLRVPVKGSQPVANSPYSYPKGAAGAHPADLRMQPIERWHNPVFDKPTLDRMVAEGLDRLKDFQHSDGGWGWWPVDSSDPFITCYVVLGLQQARDAGYTIPAGMISGGVAFLHSRFLSINSRTSDVDLPLLTYEARVLATEPSERNAVRNEVTGYLFDRRDRLSPYNKALLALALHSIGDTEKAALMLRNAENTVRMDEGNGTAHWQNEGRYWWYWYQNSVETNATLLQAYVEIEPKSALAPMIAKWLVNNRRGAQWSSTRETAIAIASLCEYSRSAGELAPNYTLTVDYGGRVRRSFNVTHENALLYDNTFVVPDALLQSGTTSLTITKEGKGSCYYAAYTRYFSKEEPIPATGNEIFVTRRYYRLLPNTAAGGPNDEPLDLDRPNPFLTARYELLTQGGVWTEPTDSDQGPSYERALLKSGDTVASGDQIEVELQIESKNDYNYLIFEDLKPAGCEPVELRSGGHSGLGVYSNMELRDQKVAFFISSMPQGKRMLSYRLRAEIPGEFHVLPTNAYAMYAPEMRALSDEMRLGVRDVN
jgi:uncharacterized protein YfaS (alpha-2-macroglobulin family)